VRPRGRAWLARTLLVFDPVERAALRGERAIGSGDSRARCASLLAALPLFRPLTPEQRDLLLDSATEQTFTAGHVLIRESDPPDRLFVILSGRVRVLEVATDSPVELIVGELGVGEFLGRLRVLRNQPRSATAVAIERTHRLVIPHTEVRKLLHARA